LFEILVVVLNVSRSCVQDRAPCSYDGISILIVIEVLALVDLREFAYTCVGIIQLLVNNILVDVVALIVTL